MSSDGKVVFKSKEIDIERSILSDYALEALVFRSASNICESYKGGMWEAYRVYAEGNPSPTTLTHTVQYFVPRGLKATVEALSPGFMTNVLTTPKVVGISATLLALSAYSFQLQSSKAPEGRLNCIVDGFHGLREYVIHTDELTKEEKEAIFLIID